MFQHEGTTSQRAYFHSISDEFEPHWGLIWSVQAYSDGCEICFGPIQMARGLEPIKGVYNSIFEKKILLYTLFQNKHNFLEVGFLFGKRVCQ